MGKTKISSRLKDNEAYIRERCKNCADILIRPMRIGTMGKTDCLMVYIEVAVSNMMLDDSAIGKMINHFWESSPELPVSLLYKRKPAVFFTLFSVRTF